MEGRIETGLPAVINSPKTLGLATATGVINVASKDMSADLEHSKRPPARRKIVALGAFLVAVAAEPAMAQAPQAQISDPWMGFNRGAYRFSMAVDHAVIAPVIHAYIHVTPEPVRDGLHNAIANLDEPRTVGNDILQGNFKPAGAATARFALNSVVGVAGLIDVAAKVGLPRREADFGQTLGRYGAPSGPYLFVPFAGPSSVRDGVGRLVDIFADPMLFAAGGINTTFGQVRTGVAVVDARVSVDDQMRVVTRDFTDPYATIRAAYAQQREAQIDLAKGQSAAAKAQDLPDFGPEPPPAPPAPPKS
jgi:phospholipid-binding lipoprotein MlaA